MVFLAKLRNVRTIFRATKINDFLMNFSDRFFLSVSDYGLLAITALPNRLKPD